MYRYDNEIFIGFVVLVVILGAVLLLGFVVEPDGKTETFTARVVDMSHVPSTLRTNVSPVVVPNSNGGVGVGVAVSSSGSAEENFLIVESSNGYEKVNVKNIESMYNYEIGKVYTFCAYHTWLVNIERLRECK